MSNVAFKTSFSSAGLERMQQNQKESGFSLPSGLQESKSNPMQDGVSNSFLDHLKGGIQQVQDSHKVAERLSTDVATGKGQNLHESMLALTESELSFNFLVQVRNKALEAYQEVMRMPV